MAKRTSSAEGASSIRLLLHCDDGAVPFLPPCLLNKCFPPDAVSDVLSLGLAVRDTGVVPVYPTDQTKQRKNHPRGYTFSTTTTPDPWLLAYHRVTVPSFDLLDDATTQCALAASESNGQQVSVSATDRHVNMWTTNGRVPLTPELYHGAAVALGSHLVVPLFDMILPVEKKTESNAAAQVLMTQKRYQKRAAASVARTKAFARDYLDREDTASRPVFLPLLMDQDDSLLQSQLEWIQQQEKKADGVALVGWHHSGRTIPTVPKCNTLIVLNTRSLRQVLEVATWGGNEVLVGSNLPTLWARTKRAFVVDLVDTSNTKKQRREGKESSQEAEEATLDENGCVDLITSKNEDVPQHPWFRDARPLVPTCRCWTCQTHTRSYIYHLVCAKELLAEMLLFVHNLHHVLELLRGLKQDPDRLVEYVQSQLP
jgi:hypothetical protein